MPKEPLGPDAEDEDDPASTPFDNPFFLPVVLLGFSLWLAYDGFFNAQFIADHQADDQRWVLGFNRWGALVCALFGAYFAFRAYRERTAVRGEESGS